jgi:SNF2 family DNA or RNA helicase
LGWARLLVTGTIEERMFQRQIAKRELFDTLVDDAAHKVRQVLRTLGVCL